MESGVVFIRADFDADLTEEHRDVNVLLVQMYC